MSKTVMPAEALIFQICEALNLDPNQVTELDIHLKPGGLVQVTVDMLPEPSEQLVTSAIELVALETTKVIVHGKA